MVLGMGLNGNIGHDNNLGRGNMSKITFEEAIKGACICAENGYKLAEDARRLYSKRRYSTATAIAISSLEELGKVYLLLLAAVWINNGQKIEWGTFWKTWRNHKRKQYTASFADLSLFGKDAIDLAIRTIIFEDLNIIREQSLYVDFKDTNWKTPKDTPRKWTVEVLEAAESLAFEFKREFNLRRYHLVLKEIKEVKIPITQEKLNRNPLFANLLEGINEIEKKINNINIKASNYPIRYGS
ncbi:MAG: AbiV family abortive infection protein [Thermoplasmata archaeon]|nr:MAG: AbiV family abortive infection protein [Thermoplasmata archaeon]